MNHPSKTEQKRLTHINHLMDTIHDSSNDIYENLVDRDFKGIKSSIKSLIIILKEIQNSVEDEI
jgi:hypothetical protein